SPVVTLLPYPTLFRSRAHRGGARALRLRLRPGPLGVRAARLDGPEVRPAPRPRRASAHHRNASPIACRTRHRSPGRRAVGASARRRSREQSGGDANRPRAEVYTLPRRARPIAVLRGGLRLDDELSDEPVAREAASDRKAADDPRRNRSAALSRRRGIARRATARVRDRP